MKEDAYWRWWRYARAFWPLRAHVFFALQEFWGLAFCEITHSILFSGNVCKGLWTPMQLRSLYLEETLTTALGMREWVEPTFHERVNCIWPWEICTPAFRVQWRSAASPPTSVICLSSHCKVCNFLHFAHQYREKSNVLRFVWACTPCKTIISLHAVSSMCETRTTLFAIWCSLSNWKLGQLLYSSLKSEFSLRAFFIFQWKPVSVHRYGSA